MEGIDLVARFMAISATTAPKSKGENFVRTKILLGEELQQTARAMEKFGQKTGKKDFDRDAKGVAQSEAVVLVGLKEAKPLGLNCGACGFEDCSTLQKQKRTSGEFQGPVCSFRHLDMGIALGSAVKTAADLNVDNRIMYRIGAAVRDMGLVDWEFVMGIPLSAAGKNIFFDR
ncbi:MAG: DUF2148 domain-containing protein [Desulfohalobiaceae bacterium]|nr:DUF2148 domain-containing protein [Desulfohalobiaceae bacterium]